MEFENGNNSRLSWPLLRTETPGLLRQQEMRLAETGAQTNGSLCSGKGRILKPWCLVENDKLVALSLQIPEPAFNLMLETMSSMLLPLTQGRKPYRTPQTIIKRSLILLLRL